MVAANHEELHSMKDHDLLVRIAVKTDALEEHSRVQNGQISELNNAQLKLEGAMSFGRWLLGTALAVVAIASTVGGAAIFRVIYGS